MEELTRITDTDAGSLDSRVLVALEQGGGRCVVRRFTYWYTNRQPVYEAVVLRSVPGAGR